MTPLPSDAFRTTLAGARNILENRPLNRDEIERVVKYLESPGSGPTPDSSFADFVREKLQSHPAALREGQSYVVFSGVDAGGTPNFDNASSYVRESDGRAGIIGDTPWGKYADSARADSEIAAISLKLGRRMNDMGFMVRSHDNVGAVTDMLWNYGSPEFARNAVLSRNHVVGFLENAPENRGFTNHELPVFQSNDSVRLNGIRLSRANGDIVEIARGSTNVYLQVERDLASASSKIDGRHVPISEVRAKIDLAYGYDGDANLLFGRSRTDFSGQSIDAMAREADAWSQANARNTGNIHYVTPLQRYSALANEVSKTDHLASRDSSPLRSAGSAFEVQNSAALGPLEHRMASPAVRGLAGAGTAALVADAVASTGNVKDLHIAGNRIGAQSEIVHFAGRNLGGWGGAVAGAEAAALLASESGPGALVAGTIGGIAGAVAGDEIATRVDDYRTYNQSDSQGQSWHMDPTRPDLGWTRSETRIDPNGPSVPGFGFSALAYKTQTITAPPEIANELNYKASGVQVQLALAHPPAPRDPYSIKADPADTPSLREANWQRDAGTHAWSRSVTTGYMEHGLPVTRTELASPDRTRELERASSQVAEENRANRPEAIAGKYRDAYLRYGWGHFGDPEEAAMKALHAPKDVLQASDGNEYKRGPDGAWKHEGWFGHESRATGNLRDELNEAARSNGIHAPPTKQDAPSSTAHDRINEMLEAARNGDWNRFRQDTQAFADMPPGQQLQQNALQQANQIEQHAEQQRAAQRQQQQNEQQQQQTQQQAHGPRMVR